AVEPAGSAAEPVAWGVAALGATVAAGWPVAWGVAALGAIVAVWFTIAGAGGGCGFVGWADAVAPAKLSMLAAPTAAPPARIRR
ncbi:MAG: hypothetical protein ACPHCN_14035, partial [Mycobacterium sp.]